jgi:Ca-activated chloride channel family protein
MKSRLLSSLLILATLTCVLVQSASSQTPTEVEDVIRVDTDLTSLLFTATDKNNRFITTLQEADLRLTEDSEVQKIVTFQRETDRPLSIAFLIDVSASEERTLPQEKAAVRTFIETVIKSSRDQAAIIAFTGPTFLEQKLTRDVISLYHALDRVDVAMPTYMGTGRPINGIASRPGLRRPPPGGTTAIWEAIFLTASEVLAGDSGKLGLNQKRRAIILLTDGWDTSSRLNMQEAITSALAGETIIYAIGIGDSKREGIDKNALETLAEATGGRAFFPKKDSDLKNAFAEIEQELRSQYLITYSPTNKRRDGSFRQMRLWLTNPQLQKDKVQLRYRPGYFAKPRPAVAR